MNMTAITGKKSLFGFQAWVCAACLALFVLSAGGARAEEVDPLSLRMIATFDDGIQNRLGGYYNKFESPPSSASTFLSTDVFRGAGGSALRVEARQRAGGFCGVWMHFFDFRAEEKRFLDTRNYAFLSFWVRGQEGGERFTVKMADEHWIGLEDSVPLGPVTKYLPDGVTTNWQEVRVPLAEITSLDRMHMGGITLDFTEPGDYTVYLDDFSLKTTAEISTPETKASAVKQVAGRAYPRAMWIWHTEPLLMDAAARQQLFDFCREENVDTLWVQLLAPFEPGLDAFVPPSTNIPAHCVATILHPDETRAFLREAHRAGLKVHALDGYPEYALKEFHPIPLALVDAVIAFNRDAAPEERFDGIHFDNEPYLIIGWHDEMRREEILAQFLDLNSEIQRRVREQSSMVFGVDIPFWWQERDETTGKVSGMVTWNGERKAASYHCIDLLDNVGIMNYRDAADGADGIIAHGLDLLEYADKAGRAEVYMGVETFTYPLIDVWFVLGLPRPQFEELVKQDGAAFARLSRVRGFRTQIFDDGSNLHIGIELPPEVTPDKEKEIRGTLAHIAEQYGAVAHRDLEEKMDSIRMDAEFGITANVEWMNPRRRDMERLDGEGAIPGFVATSLMLPKITFADETYEYLQEQLRASEAAFSRYTSFAGMAIHYYETYRDKRDESKKDVTK
jgi:hypothetical protein